jgi:hypothetical protein
LLWPSGFDSRHRRRWQTVISAGGVAFVILSDFAFIVTVPIAG